MIPIVREYFRGLKERDELDVIVPELLTGMGFEVISRPMVGTRQYGSDIAAIGTDTDGVRKLFLFSVKRGDLNRTEWNGPSEQALRPSLDEIKDAYLQGVAPEHAGLPVVIVITIGGVVLENVQPQLNGYIRSNRTTKLDYRVWSGDTLTAKVMDGALREEIFPSELRSALRKASAMVEEPDVAMAHFQHLVEVVAEDNAQGAVSRVRVMYLALWILFVWGREADNLEAPYRASELVVLRAWDLLWRDIESDTGRKLEASHAFFEVVQLHLRIWEWLYERKVLPHAGSRHALSFAVGAPHSVDINLALFETAGRIAMGGLWKIWMETPAGEPPRLTSDLREDVERVALQLAQMPFENPAMFVPAADEQAIDICLALLFLGSVPSTRVPAAAWVRQITGATIMAYRHHLRYPIVDDSYSTLIRHPMQRTDGYRVEMTQGSLLYPLLAMFAWAVGDETTVRKLSEFQTTDLQHCNFQTWVPNSRTDDKIWSGDRYQGSSLHHLRIGEDGAELLDQLRKETAANNDYPALSAIRLNHWPILLLACRHYRLPPPPQIWMQLLDDLRAVKAQTPMHMQRRRYGIKRFRNALRRSVSALTIAATVGDISLADDDASESSANHQPTV